MIKQKLIFIIAIIISIFLVYGCNSKNDNQNNNYEGKIILDEQGSFAFGGTVSEAAGEFNGYELFPSSNGQTYHSDHGYAFYQIPINARKYPIVFLHGGGQSARSFETTPDGREGFQNIFLKKGFSVYLVDQPRRGRAGRSSVSTMVDVAPNEQYLFNWFRLGFYPEVNEGVQFKMDEETLNQYYRQATPNTGAFDEEVISDAMSELFNKIGEGILVAHSQGGGPAFFTAIKNNKVKSLVLYEPGGCTFPFPAGEMPSSNDITMPAFLPIQEISVEDFNKLAQIPIVLYFGDFIPNEHSENPFAEEWRLRIGLMKIWEDTLRKHGGDVEIVMLPEVGIYGNTHFPFSDLNNVEVADLLYKYLEDKKLN